ncbi:MAG: hypothetical protein RJQ08_11300 [Salinisphaeraceae bacterium]
MKGCRDNSCVIEKPTGMATNGGCRCRPWQLRAEIVRLQSENSKLKSLGIELAHDAIAVAEATYAGRQTYPSYQRRYDRDTAAASEMLAIARPASDSDDDPA